LFVCAARITRVFQRAHFDGIPAGCRANASSRGAENAQRTTHAATHGQILICSESSRLAFSIAGATNGIVDFCE